VGCEWVLGGGGRCIGSSRFTGLNIGPGCCDEDEEGDGSIDDGAILECAAGGAGGGSGGGGGGAGCCGCDCDCGGGGTGEGR